jgi:LCP family protein required for cell wall assembly
VNSESSPRPARIILIIVIAAIVLVAGFFGLRNLVRGSGHPMPTLAPTAVAIQVTDEPTATATATATATRTSLPPTNTPEATATEEVEEETATPDGTTVAASEPTEEPTPTQTLSPTPSPTSKPQLVPSLALITGTRFIVNPNAATPVPTFAVPLGTTNILLLGSDIALDEGVGRTDTMIILAINRDGPTASMVSLPRDLWVYIPGWTNNRLNTALSRGSSVGFPGGAVAQLTDTIMHNFGIPIHYYAQIDFAGFKQGVDAIGGVEVAVSCQLRDWRLKSPELDPENEDNWEMFTLEPGIHYMDGDMALWYARSRRTTSDFDRGRRQQQLLRATLATGVDLNLLPQLPDLWSTYQDTVKTNMDIGRMLQIAALAPEIDKNGIQHLYLVGDDIQPYIVPESGAQVQLPVWENMQDTLRRLFLPPALNQASRPPITVEVVNGTDNPDLALLAADNLGWYGFEPIISDEQVEGQRSTTIEYYAQNTKGSFDWLLSWIMDKPKSTIELVPDTVYDYDYRVVIGDEYDPCRPQLFAPQIYVAQ